MADWGTYSALRGRKEDFAQKRQDFAANIEAQQAQVQLDDLRIKEQKASRTAVENYFSELESMDMPEPSKNRVRNLINNYKPAIREAISKANGDYNKFMLSGGQALLNQFKIDVVSSEEVKDGLLSKASLLTSQQNGLAGKIHRMVNYERPDGQYERLPFNVAKKKYEDGELDYLPYSGAFEPTDFSKYNQYFANNFRSGVPKSEPVTPEDMFDFALRIHGDEAYAAQVRDEYQAQMQQGLKPYFWGVNRLPQRDPNRGGGSGPQGNVSLIESLLDPSSYTPENTAVDATLSPNTESNNAQTSMTVVTNQAGEELFKVDKVFNANLSNETVNRLTDLLGIYNAETDPKEEPKLTTDYRGDALSTSGNFIPGDVVGEILSDNSTEIVGSPQIKVITGIIPGSEDKDGDPQTVSKQVVEIVLRSRGMDDILKSYYTNRSGDISNELFGKDDFSVLIPIENIAAFGKVLEDQKKESNIQAESARDISKGNQSFIFQE